MIKESCFFFSFLFLMSLRSTIFMLTIFFSLNTAGNIFITWKCPRSHTEQGSFSDESQTCHIFVREGLRWERTVRFVAFACPGFNIPSFSYSTLISYYSNFCQNRAWEPCLATSLSQGILNLEWSEGKDYRDTGTSSGRFLLTRLAAGFSCLAFTVTEDPIIRFLEFLLY